MAGRIYTSSGTVRAIAGSLFPPPLAGEGREGANSTAQTRCKYPLPNPPPQAGEGKEGGTVHIAAPIVTHRGRTARATRPQGWTYSWGRGRAALPTLHAGIATMCKLLALPDYLSSG